MIYLIKSFYCWYTCYSCITIFINRKTKTDVDIRWKKPTYNCCYYITICLLYSIIYLFLSQLLHIIIFTSKKSKTANNVLDKKPLLLIYLLSPYYYLYKQKSKNRSKYEKEKAHLQLLPWYYNFYEQKYKVKKRISCKKNYNKR